MTEIKGEPGVDLPRIPIAEVAMETLSRFDRIIETLREAEQDPNRRLSNAREGAVDNFDFIVSTIAPALRDLAQRQEIEVPLVGAKTAIGDLVGSFTFRGSIWYGSSPNSSGYLAVHDWWGNGGGLLWKRAEVQDAFEDRATHGLVRRFGGLSKTQLVEKFEKAIKPFTKKKHR